MSCKRGLLSFILTLTLVVSAACQATSAPTQQGTLRVATWNLLNLFDNADHPTKPDEGTAPKSLADIRAMAKVIDALNADVLGVQEVENREVLEMLNRQLKRPFLHIELMEGNDRRGIDVGVMSRLPIERSTSHRLMPLAEDHRFARDFPVFRIRLSKQHVFDFGVVHFKSKGGKKSRSDAWRKAEADGVASLVSKIAKDKSSLGLIVCGDFNDYRDSAPLRNLMSTMVDHTVSIPEEERFTFIHRGKGEQIDFVLGTQGLNSKKARVHRDTNFASDHFPVVVHFSVPQKIVRPEVPAGTPRVEPKRPSLQATDLKSVKTHFLKEVQVTGKVVKVFRPKNGGGSAILNFHGDYWKAIQVYIPRGSAGQFGDLDKFVGKTIAVSGPISKHRKNYQIVVTRKEQLSIK